MAPLPEISPETYSQFGEDRLVLDYFERTLGIRKGSFAEVGANHPTLLSQSYLLEKNGWRGLLADANSASYAVLREGRPEARVFHCAVGAPEEEGKALELRCAGQVSYIAGKGSVDAPPEEETTSETVTIRTLDALLAEAGAGAGPGTVDFVSIDVEGMELDVLRGFSLEKWKPRLLLIEDHWHHYAVHFHLKARGYLLAKRTGCNSWYIPRGQARPETTFAERFHRVRRMWLNAPPRLLKVRLRAARRAGGE